MIRLTVLTALACLLMDASVQAAERTLPIRERSEASLLDGAVTLKVVKLKGYYVDIRMNDEKQTLKIGQTVSPPGSDCRITFVKISPETPIARFSTDCP
ncbi:MAG: hypothetical protein AAF401_16215 [Pseudomonadota bacterium]